MKIVPGTGCLAIASMLAFTGNLCHDIAMSAALDLPHPMMLTEFLAWDAPDGCLWQLVDGEPMAMAPANPGHAVIQSTLSRIIGNHLLSRGGPCIAASNPGVLLGRKQDRNFRIPDLGVTCSPLVQGEFALPNPILLVEILSPGNAAETWRNVWDYTTISTVRDILVIRTDVPGAQLLRRSTDGGWPAAPVPIDSGAVVLDSIDLHLPLNDVYAGTWLAAPAA